MGAGNVKLVYVHWRHLPHAPFRALTYMALVSLDNDDPPLFWAGRGDLAFALGRIVPPEDDDDLAVTKERRAAFRAADRVLRDLTDYSAIKIAKPAAPGRNTHYALNLHPRSTLSVVRSDHGGRGPSPSPNGSDTAPAGGNEPRSADSTDHGERTERTTASEPTDHAHRGSEEYEEDGGLNRGKKKADRRYRGTGSARTREADGNDDSSTVDDTAEQTEPEPDARPDCDRCGTLLDPDGTCFVCSPGAMWRTA